MTLGTATFNEIRVSQEFEWARLLWEESTGRVIVLSAHGNWSYCWAHIGTDTLAEFLASLHMEYVGGKFFGSALREFSLDETVSFIRQEIMDCRKSAVWKDDKKSASEWARHEWNLVHSLNDGEIDFRDWFQETSFDDAYEYRRTSIRADWVSFWERTWLKFIVPELKACIPC